MCVNDREPERISCHAILCLRWENGPAIWRQLKFYKSFRIKYAYLYVYLMRDFWRRQRYYWMQWCSSLLAGDFNYSSELHCASSRMCGLSVATSMLSYACTCTGEIYCSLVRFIYNSLWHQALLFAINGTQQKCILTCAVFVGSMQWRVQL